MHDWSGKMFSQKGGILGGGGRLFLPQDIRWIAVALVSAPGVDAGMTLERVAARKAHGLAKPFTGQDAFVELARECGCGGIVHGPACGNHCAHAHTYELRGDVGSELVAVIAPGVLLAC